MALSLEEQLALLYKRKAYLLSKLTSGVAEIDQPQLGRTVYRSTEDIMLALRLLEQEIAALTGDQRQMRHAFCPVVREC